MRRVLESLKDAARNASMGMGYRARITMQVLARFPDSAAAAKNLSLALRGVAPIGARGTGAQAIPPPDPASRSIPLRNHRTTNRGPPAAALSALHRTA